MLWWLPGAAAGEWEVLCLSRARTVRQHRGLCTVQALVEDVVLCLWGNNLFAGVSSAHLEPPPGSWDIHFVCTTLCAPDPWTAPSPLVLVPYSTLEMAVVLGHVAVEVQANGIAQRVAVDAVAPNLTLEHLAAQRMDDEALKRLSVGNRIAAGGFSHIYLGKVRPAEPREDEEHSLVAVKQYIQRKPIFFSFDTPEERAAKTREMEEGAVVVFRRLHQEVRMLTAKGETRGERSSDGVLTWARRALGHGRRAALGPRGCAAPAFVGLVQPEAAVRAHALL